MKYSLSQYVHDGFRLKLIETEQAELRKVAANPEWKVARGMELQRQWLDLTARMFKYERHPNNRG